MLSMDARHSTRKGRFRSSAETVLPIFGLASLAATRSFVIANPPARKPREATASTATHSSSRPASRDCTPAALVE